MKVVKETECYTLKEVDELTIGIADEFSMMLFDVEDARKLRNDLDVWIATRRIAELERRQELRRQALAQQRNKQYELDFLNGGKN